MELSLGLSSNYNTPINYWLEMRLVKLNDYARIVYETEKVKKQTFQEVGPGL
jgi:hypothetical protein